MTISYDQAVAYIAEERGKCIERAMASGNPIGEAVAQGIRLSILAEGVAHVLEVPVEAFKEDVMKVVEALHHSAADAQQQAGGVRP